MNILPDKKEHDRLGAGHVNTLNRAARQVLAKNIGNYGFGGPEGSFSGLPPFVQQQCQIVALGFNTTDDSGDSSGSPLQDDLYTIRFYYWDQDSLSWKVDYRGEGYLLDDKLQQSNYSVGDKVTAYWDAQRNAFCPIKGGGGSNLINGIVHACLTEGYYEVEISEWTGRTPDQESGDQSSGANSCGVCSFVAPGGSSSGGCTEDPPLPDFADSDSEEDNVIRRQTTGTGVIVLAYDPGSIFIPLVIGSDCLMENTGDENPTASTEGSQSSGDTEPVYKIVRGHQEHLKFYREVWDCCNGEDTLISRKAIIFPGVECPEEVCVVCE